MCSWAAVDAAAIWESQHVMSEASAFATAIAFGSDEMSDCNDVIFDF